MRHGGWRLVARPRQGAAVNAGDAAANTANAARDATAAAAAAITAAAAAAAAAATTATVTAAAAAPVGAATSPDVEPATAAADRPDPPHPQGARQQPCTDGPPAVLLIVRVSLAQAEPRRRVDPAWHWVGGPAECPRRQRIAAGQRHAVAAGKRPSAAAVEVGALGVPNHRPVATEKVANKRRVRARVEGQHGGGGRFRSAPARHRGARCGRHGGGRVHHIGGGSIVAASAAGAASTRHRARRGRGGG